MSLGKSGSGALSRMRQNSNKASNVSKQKATMFEAVNKSLTGMVRYQEAHASNYMDDDKKEFKMLTEFVNSYKSKLNIGNSKITSHLGNQQQQFAKTLKKQRP